MTSSTHHPHSTAPGEKSRHFLADAAVYGFAGVLVQGLSFFLLPLYTHYLEPADYGILDLVNQIGLVANTVLMLNGIQLAAMTFFLQAKSDQDRRRVVSGLVSVILFGVVGGVLLMLLLAPLLCYGFKLPHSSWLVLLGGITVLAEILPDAPYTLMQARLESTRFLRWNVGTLFVRLLTTILVVAVFQGGVWGILWVRAIAGFVTGTVLLAKEVGHGWVWPSRALVWSLVRYALPMVPVGVFGFLSNGAQRLWLLAHNGPAVLGLYSLGATLCFAGGLLIVTPLHKVWTAKMYAVHEAADAARRLGAVATKFAFVHGAAALGLVLFGREVLAIFSTDSYAGAEVVLIPLLLGSVIETFTNIPDQVFFVRHKTKWKPAISGTTAALAIGVYAVLMPRFGIYGAAWGVCAAATIRAAITIAVSRRVFPIHFELVKLLQLGALTIVAGGLGLQCPATLSGVAAKAACYLGWLLAVVALAIVPRSDFVEVLRFAQSLLGGAGFTIFSSGRGKRQPREETRFRPELKIVDPAPGAPLAVVLGGGRNALGAIRGLGIQRVPTWLVSFARSDAATYSRFLQNKIYVDSADEDAFPDRLAEILQERVPPGSVLLPTSDLVLDALQRHRTALNARFALPTRAAIPLEVFLDKWDEAQLLASHDVPFPATCHVSSLPVGEIAKRLGFPLVVKPRRETDGHLIGGKARVVTSLTDLELWANTRRHALDQVVFQEYVPGDEGAVWSCYAVFDRQSALVQAFTFHCLTTLPPGTGATTCAVSARNERLVEITAALAKAISYVGPAVVDFKYDSRDGEFKYLEWNARVGGTNWLATVSGMNQAYSAYCVAAGLPVKSANSQKEGTVYVDLMGDLESRRRSGMGWPGIGCFHAKHLLTRRASPYWWWRDPMPGAFCGYGILRRVVRRVFRRRKVQVLQPSAAC